MKVLAAFLLFENVEQTKTASLMIWIPEYILDISISDYRLKALLLSIYQDCTRQLICCSVTQLCPQNTWSKLPVNCLLHLKKKKGCKVLQLVMRKEKVNTSLTNQIRGKNVECVCFFWLKKLSTVIEKAPVIKGLWQTTWNGSLDPWRSFIGPTCRAIPQSPRTLSGEPGPPSRSFPCTQQGGYLPAWPCTA